MAKASVAIAGCLFNDGAGAYKSILSYLGFSYGKYTSEFCESKDKSRIYFAKKRVTQASKEYRTMRIGIVDFIFYSGISSGYGEFYFLERLTI